jgi:alkanesulfonate monooxygenase SsuD/methylene tetrahydromethanopterin reductase-like flavin-dependent oxidoreductase (luciferase family)
VFLLAGRFPGQDDTEALERSLEAVVAAESAGFDDAWMAEHHFVPYGVCPSAITFAAYAAGRTRRIALSTAVSVLSTTHPVALAEQVALVDQLSGGRFHLGVGRGGPWVDLEVFGTGLDSYEQGFAERLDLLLQCLVDERVHATGDRIAFRDVTMVPRPRTRPHPPVTVACTSPATVELAAARGLPMLLGMHIDDDDKAHMVTHYAKAARAAGRDPDAVDHVAAVLAHVADSGHDARQELRATMPGWLAEGLGAHVTVDGRPRPTRDPHAYIELLCAIHAVGSPAECIDRLHTSAARTGIRHLIMMVEGAGTRTRTLDNIARLGDEVLPHL